MSRLWWEVRWQVRMLGFAVFWPSRAERRVAVQRSEATFRRQR